MTSACITLDAASERKGRERLDKTRGKRKQKSHKEWKVKTSKERCNPTLPYFATAKRTMASRNSKRMRACSSFTATEGSFLSGW